MVKVLDLVPGEAVRENYRRQGAAAERELIAKAFLNNSTLIADLYRIGHVAEAETLIEALIRGVK